MEVINAALPQLVPNDFPCSIIPLEGESKEAFYNRQQVFRDKIDSAGKKIEIVSHLHKLDTLYRTAYTGWKGSAKTLHLLNSPPIDRAIKSSMVDSIFDIKVVLIGERHKTLGGHSDCSTLGQFVISRVGFNVDSTRAAFKYYLDNGSCTHGEGGVINLERVNDKWNLE